MKFALINGHRDLPTPKTIGECPTCGSELIAKCGEQKVWHWAHKARLHCDRWWEPETQWHREWKNKFPTDCQEIVHTAEDNERHIADVKTTQGKVIEFQHSYLQPEERRSREAFYEDMVWVVDGLRRMRDPKKFDELIRDSMIWNVAPFEVKLTWIEGALLRDWFESKFPVLFDFGRPELWCLKPVKTNGAIFVPVDAEAFVGWCSGTGGLSAYDWEQALKFVGSDRQPLFSPEKIARFVEARLRQEPSAKIKPTQPQRTSSSRSRYGRRWPIRRF